ncbi:MAG: YfiR family protein [Bacteroidetes bacterium]|nr:YfiR family protein [Bacteroidota bacterium]MBT6688101.1 YfiR family protein [Bacteroidota bacterium]MBT7143706.1 YfiR family protein [Bacteroidota bacterium]MBT7490392.1 YfiR family protein [Bacteroidota bacterium]
MKNNLYLIKSALSLLMFFSLSVHSYCQTDEYLMKAGFIEKFTRFINWPNDSVQSDTNRPFIITVLGENTFGSSLDEFYLDTKIKNRHVILKYISDFDELSLCHILFVSGNCKNNLEQIIDFSNKHSILTISETKGFAKKGILINFYFEKNKIRFEMNKKAFNISNLEVSHHLFKIAKII